MERQPKDWENKTANYSTNEGLISIMYKIAHTTQNQKNKQFTQKMGRRNKHFYQEDRWPTGTSKDAHLDSPAAIKSRHCPGSCLWLESSLCLRETDSQA